MMIGSTRRRRLNTAVMEAWERAAEELGLEIQSPFVLHLQDGRQMMFELLLKGFGSSEGILITTTDRIDWWKEAEDLGYAWSIVNPLYHSAYDRAYFIEILEDWGWFGPSEKRPDWYRSGRPEAR